MATSFGPGCGNDMQAQARASHRGQSPGFQRIRIGALTEVAAEHDLSLTQLRMLGILRDREPTMADLATFTGLERSTVSGLIDRAAQRGLVVRTADPRDGRSVRVSLTKQARGLVPEVTAAIGDRIKPLTSQLSAGEQKRLTALLTKALGL